YFFFGITSKLKKGIYRLPCPCIHQLFIDRLLLPKQRQAVEQFLTANEPTPLLLERVGGRNGMKYKPGHLPCNTILRSHFTDHKGCNRSKFPDIWLPDGTVKSLSSD
ncbi:MAG: hypothetical protein V7L00_32935, partial [Nostoc sp.]